jgi:hypothetical protein
MEVNYERDSDIIDGFTTPQDAHALSPEMSKIVDGFEEPEVLECVETGYDVPDAVTNVRPVSELPTSQRKKKFSARALLLWAVFKLSGPMNKVL